MEQKCRKLLHGIRGTIIISVHVLREFRNQSAARHELSIELHPNFQSYLFCARVHLTTVKMTSNFIFEEAQKYSRRTAEQNTVALIFHYVSKSCEKE